MWDSKGRKVAVGSGIELQIMLAGKVEVGAFMSHPVATASKRCGGTLWFNVPEAPEGPKWDVIKRSPLTLTPSIACSCGMHGFVTDGKWVDA
jgi:hypothetical protein